VRGNVSQATKKTLSNAIRYLIITAYTMFVVLLMLGNFFMAYLFFFLGNSASQYLTMFAFSALLWAVFELSVMHSSAFLKPHPMKKINKI